MEALLQWGVELIIWVQQLRPLLDIPMRVITFIGDEPFFLMLLPLVYWCTDRRTGARLTVLFLLSAYVNSAVKVLAAQPRPIEVDDRVWAYSAVGGSGGFPSGHTQSSVVVWGYLASQLRKPWLWIWMVAAVILIPFSRIYLGVHFPQDLLGGYVIGALLLWAFLSWGSAAERWIGARSLVVQLVIIVVGALLLIVLLPTEDGITQGATLLGACTGLALEQRYLRFKVDGPLGQRALRLALGLLVLVGLWGGLRVIFAALEPAWLFRGLRYTLVGLWAGVGGPWAFVRLKLAQTATLDAA